MASNDTAKYTELKAIEVEELKGLHNCKIEFKKPLTAIMGVNGVGKSTIIHALACSFQPCTENSDSFRYCDFFLPTTNSTWKNSHFTVKYDLLDKKDDSIKNSVTKNYQKAVDRWMPRLKSRPQKDIKYIGISTCLPEIERVKFSRIDFSTTEQNDDESKKILKIVGGILNKDYASLTSNIKANKAFLGVVTGSNISYSSLSMGAGEQRVFKIVTELVRAKKYSLILIDEIDLLLHSDALKRLIKIIDDYAKKKTLQVIFTTHSLVMNELQHIVDIKYLESIDGKVNVYDGLTSLAWQGLTGEASRPIKVFVEDRFSEFIVKEVAKELDIKSKVQIGRFGVIQNAFTLAASFVIRKESAENVMILTDGDEYVTREEKLNQIKKHISGTEEDVQERWEKACNLISQYNLDGGLAPEEYIHKQICELESDDEIVGIAKSIQGVVDSHEWVDKIASIYDEKSDSSYKEIISVFSKTSGWNSFVEPLKKWLEERKNL